MTTDFSPCASTVLAPRSSASSCARPSPALADVALPLSRFPLLAPEFVPPVDPSAVPVWSDEFNSETGGSPDPQRWMPNVGGSGWGNDDLQYHTDRPGVNAEVLDGTLRIRALGESYAGRGYTSARLASNYARGCGGSWSPVGTRTSVRARLRDCAALGARAGMWLLPAEVRYGGVSTESGKLSAVNHYGHSPGRIWGTVQAEEYSRRWGREMTSSIEVDPDGWHVYEIVWIEEESDGGGDGKEGAIIFAVDGVEYQRFTKLGCFGHRDWPFDRDFFLVLSLSVGGDLGGEKGINATAFEGPEGQTMEVDYVRVYDVSAGQSTMTDGPTSAPMVATATVAPTSVSTEAAAMNVPTAAPAEAATDAPTAAPMEPATDAPTTAPTEATTDAPAAAPMEAATDAPTDVPVKATTNAPTAAPMETATDAPTPAPVEAATEAPTAAPVETKTTAAPTSGPTEDADETQQPAASSPAETPSPVDTKTGVAPTSSAPRGGPGGTRGQPALAAWVVWSLCFLLVVGALEVS